MELGRQVCRQMISKQTGREGERGERENGGEGEGEREISQGKKCLDQYKQTRDSSKELTNEEIIV